jgi:exodeoxyribonuclease VII large subunit
VDELRFRLDTAWGRALTTAREQQATLEARLHRQDMARQLVQRKENLQTLRHRLQRASLPLLDRQRHRSQQARNRLQALSPLAVLERGYALVYSEEARLVKDGSQLHTNETVRLRFARGSAMANIVETFSPNAKRNQDKDTTKE